MKLLVLLIAALALATPAPLVGQNGESVTTAALIQPGDSVSITVWRNAELSGVFLVGTGGAIEHPLYRDVQLGGLALDVAEERLGAYLSRYTETPQFVLAPRFRVLVSGQVIRPGLYSFGPEFTIAQAIATAGGATEIGRTDRAVLIRNGERHVIQIRGADAEGLNLTVRSGDQLSIERRRNVLREYVIPGMSVMNGVLSLVTIFLIL
jgi:polysaccharide biosynthesis/export protein